MRKPVSPTTLETSDEHTMPQLAEIRQFAGSTFRNGDFLHNFSERIGDFVISGDLAKGHTKFLELSPSCHRWHESLTKSADGRVDDSLNLTREW